jgi:hypothetical protein
MKRLIFLTPYLLIFLLFSGCSGVTRDVKTFQSDIFAFDDANAIRSTEFVKQLTKHWDMNRAAIVELVGPKLNGADYARLKYAIDEITLIAKSKDFLTEEQVGRGIILFGKLVEAGTKEIIDNVVPKLVEAFMKLKGLT